MGLVRIFGVGMAFTAALTVATACGSKESSSPSSTTSSAPPSGVAKLGDYTYLLLQASDVGSDATTTGPPMQNPGGVAGAAVTFGNSDRSRTVDDLVVIFTDPTVAAQQAKERAQSFGKYVTTAPAAVRRRDERTDRDGPVARQLKSGDLCDLRRGEGGRRLGV
jgi:hypothetical protein